MMPCSCAASSASAICFAIGSASSSGHRSARNALRQILPFDELHHQGRVTPSTLFEAVDRGDVRVIERGERFGFALETREALGVRRERVRQDLDRDLAAERGVGGPPDLPHAAFADGRGDFIDAEATAGGQGQSVGILSRGPDPAVQRLYSLGVRRRVFSVGLALSGALWVATLLGAQAPAPTPAPSTPVSFAKDIFPVLEASCLTCHGAAMQLAKLDLRTRESALAAALMARPSFLATRSRAGCIGSWRASKRAGMPMSGEPLDAGADRRDQGLDRSGRGVGRANDRDRQQCGEPTRRARAHGHHARAAQLLGVQAAGAGAVPVVANKDLTNPIDRFLEKARVDRGLKAAPRADRLTLVRRAYLDLLGLPPTPAQVAAFIADQTPRPGSGSSTRCSRRRTTASARAATGSTWRATPTRAASSTTSHRPNAWRYRDYVIKSFNDDKPYNLFLTEQIAGDEMDWTTHDSLIATGFLRMGPRVLFREKDNPERRYDYLDEIIGTIGKGMLGLTVNARAATTTSSIRSPQKDYYAMQASLVRLRRDRGAARAPRRGRGVPGEERRRSTRKLAALRAEIARSRSRTATRWSSSRVQASSRRTSTARRSQAREASGRRAKSCWPSRSFDGGQRRRGARSTRSCRRTSSPRRRSWQRRSRRSRSSGPAPSADGRDRHRRRLSLLAARRGRRHRQLPEVPNSAAVPAAAILHKDRDGTKSPPSYFLIRGDPESRGSLMKPGFIGVITYGNPPTEIPRPDGTHVGPPARAGASGSRRRRTR